MPAMCLLALFMHYEEDLHHSPKYNMYEHRKESVSNKILIYCFKVYLTSQRNYKIRNFFYCTSPPSISHFLFTSKMYKTIFAIKVETSKCHNSVSTKTLEKFCPLKKNIRLNAMCSSLKNKSTRCIRRADMPPATACQKPKYVQLVSSIIQTGIIENI